MWLSPFQDCIHMILNRCLLAVGVSLQLWIIIDIWSGWLGNLHRDTRFLISLLSFCFLGVSLLVALVVVLISHGNKSARRDLVSVAVVSLVSVIIYTLGGSPPFEISRDALDSWVEDYEEGPGSAVDHRPDTIRIGSYDFERISRLSVGDFLFEESVPDRTPYGSGVIFGNPEFALKGRFQSFTFDSLGNGWFEYRGSL